LFLTLSKLRLLHFNMLSENKHRKCLTSNVKLRMKEIALGEII